MGYVRTFSALLALILALGVSPAFAQQTGAIVGKVVDSGGGVLPGVTVEAKSDVLPTPRVATTGSDGSYRLPALPPGNYTLTFTLQGMQTVTRQAAVQLQQDTVADATLGVGAVSETVEVTASATLVDSSTATIKSGVSNEQIMSLPTGQEYRDLLKLIPGVQLTQDAVRGPSAGGSGQDNVYQFDGANVTLPLFGTLASEPASHDIAQVTTIKGGARAIDFDRSGGFTIDSVSKSGTNRFSGSLGFEYQGANMVAEQVTGSRSRYEQDRQWLTLSAGGPVVTEKLFFYGSYFRPENSRDNRANDYGELPDYKRTRNEGFGKLTYTPISSILLNGSYRASKREDRSDLFGQSSAPTTGTGEESEQRIGIVEGSWVVNNRSHASFKYTYFGLESLGRPDFIADVTPNPAIGTVLAINSLDTLGLFQVPSPVANQTNYNAFIQPYIDQYGYVSSTTGLKTGGGNVGYGTQFNDQDFFRDTIQFAYNLNVGSHDLHFGFQWYKDSENLVRTSNGWGTISIPGGRLANPVGTNQPAYFTARYQRQTGGGAAPIISEYISRNIEVNDTIRFGNLTLNVGVLTSMDSLYGQGLREDDSTLSGFVAAPGNRYKMYEMSFGDMFQPRASATYAYNGQDTIYGSYARYIPAASSLPRAASWDRNLIGTFIDAHFDANGVLFAAIPVNSSTGKLFQPDLEPRTTDEFLLGTSKQLTNRWSARLYGRYRESDHFWEDTNNNARILFGAPADIAAKGLYIENLAAQLGQIGTGGSAGSYVIAELDGAYTKYYEATLESEWRASNGAFVRGSYTWSKYYGNMDQDNSSTANDAAIFIGSSNIADGAGRQLWDFKDGRLRGDRPHVLKAYGYYPLPWRGTLGAFFVAQSGQPWEGWSVEPYRQFTASTDVTNRYAETAGSRRTESHQQVDLKYIQAIPLAGRTNLEFIADVYNIFDNQTGYNPQPSLVSPSFGVPRNYFDPRRLNVTVRFTF
jgi:hypothetical protein